MKKWVIYFMLICSSLIFVKTYACELNEKVVANVCSALLTQDESYLHLVNLVVRKRKFDLPAQEKGSEDLAVVMAELDSMSLYLDSVATEFLAIEADYNIYSIDKVTRIDKAYLLDKSSYPVALTKEALLALLEDHPDMFVVVEPFAINEPLAVKNGMSGNRSSLSVCVGDELRYFDLSGRCISDFKTHVGFLVFAAPTIGVKHNVFVK